MGTETGSKACENFIPLAAVACSLCACCKQWITTFQRYKNVPEKIKNVKNVKYQYSKIPVPLETLIKNVSLNLFDFLPKN